MQIGKYNCLKVSHLVDFGAYLTDDSDNEVLLPARYITTPLEPGQEIEVFIYRDSENRPIATTEKPLVTAGEFAFLNVKAVNDTGAFVDWGISKDLLVPFREQKTRMKEGRGYIIYIYVDHASQRLVGTAHIDKYLGNVLPDFNEGEKVSVLVYKRTPIGYACIVNNLHKGLIYYNEVYSPLGIGSKTTAFIKSVRPDGKIDLTLLDKAKKRSHTLAEKIVSNMERHGGKLDLGDHSSPDVIKYRFQCSKKDFKKALGLLLKERKIAKDGDGYALLTDNMCNM